MEDRTAVSTLLEINKQIASADLELRSKEDLFAENLAYRNLLDMLVTQGFPQLHEEMGKFGSLVELILEARALLRGEPELVGKIISTFERVGESIVLPEPDDLPY